MKNHAKNVVYVFLLTFGVIIALFCAGTLISRLASASTGRESALYTVCVYRSTTAEEMARKAREITRKNPTARVQVVFKDCPSGETVVEVTE